VHLKSLKIQNPENCRASAPLAGEKTLPARLAPSRATEAVALQLLHNDKGAAIVIVLAFLVMITFVVVAFFSRATANRQVENSSAAGKKAALLARSAADLVVADLKKEMINASTVNTSGSYTWLTPLEYPVGSGKYPGMVPTQNISSAVSGTNFTNLVKQSGIASAGGLIPMSTGIPASTATASLDGHKISGSRWSAPMLTGINFSDLQVPSWILVTRAGVPASQAWINSFKDPTSGNANYVIGRFAFNVYDEGGLLDVNVAGYPSSITGTNASFKGSQGLADLSQIPGVSNVDAFVKNWRNIATGQTPTDYMAYLGLGGSTTTSFGAGPKYGFLKSGTSGTTSDNRLLTRQDLIRLANNGTLGITGTALPYLTTFSRSLNAPTYAPDPARNPVTDPLQTAGAAGKLFNVDLLGSTARVTKVFTRADGTQSVIGEPILKHRFPLSRLALLSDPNADPTLIYNYFGLTRSTPSGPWVYAHNTQGVKNQILKMNQIQAQVPGREPDFFEILQNCINVGSLGKAANTDSTMQAIDQNVYFQILQIGANLIDQYDADSYPTRISFNNGAIEITGVENLPYLSRFWVKTYRYAATPDIVGLWLQSEIWNPHQQSSAPTGLGPTQFRFVAEGTGYFSAQEPKGSQTNTPVGTIIRPGPTQPGGVTFSTSGTNFVSPVLIDSPTIANASATGNNHVSDGGNNFVGIFVTSGSIPQPVDTWWGGTSMGAVPVSLYLEYLDAYGNWVAYDKLLRCSLSTGDGGANKPPGLMGMDDPFIIKADPRSRRFGSTGGWRSNGSSYGPGGQPYDNPGYTMRPDYTVGGWATTTLGAYPGWTPQAVQDGHYGYLTENSTNRDTYYADPDGVIRHGDAANFSGTNGQPLQMPTNTNTSRPIILNRPFRSVAEMGYAFRDDPWRSLNFFTKESADSALLDAFCINEQSGSALTAGVLNLNTRQQPVLKAVISGVLKDQMNPGSTLSANAEAGSMAALVTGTTSASPMMNRSELATKISPALGYDNFSNNPSDAAIKSRRESVIRALADAGDTRTWNLLIDVVAQSGRFPITASTPDKFIVEGECRYWLHVAIDRYTGQVIDQNLEVVNE
jgi:Tfp pilus assembly protein PilX